MPTTKDIGNRGEDIASIYLQQHGFVITDRNWRTRWCEIDIVATKNNTVYFVEVKYRAHAKFGSGLEYITPKKQQQMHFAAELWLQTHNYTGDAVLAAIEVDSTNQTTFVEL